MTPLNVNLIARHLNSAWMAERTITSTGDQRVESRVPIVKEYHDKTVNTLQ